MKIVMKTFVWIGILFTLYFMLMVAVILLDLGGWYGCYDETDRVYYKQQQQSRGMTP